MSTKATPPEGDAPPAAASSPTRDLLDAEEVARTRMFGVLGAVMPLSLLALLPFLGGGGPTRAVLAVSLLFASIGSVWLLFSLRRDERYDPTRLVLTGTLWLAAELAGLRYFGAFSPLVIALPLGVFFFGLTRDVRVQVLAYVSASLAFFLLAASSLHDVAGVPPTAGSLTAARAVTLVAFAEVVLAVAFASARAVRSTTMLAVARHERVSSALAQRDGLVLELRRDLARALDVAGVGRFSETVVGNYRLGGVLGRGAMGEVYEAEHVDTHVEAAVKVLHAHTLREPGSVERFLREAKMASAVDTPHAVRILEVGGVDDALPYLAMERLRGDDLADLLRQRAQLTLAEILRLLTEIGAALAAARAVGIVHRDVKPRNLFLTAVGSPGDGPATRWKLLDFGVSRFTTSEAAEADGRVIGTPEYMAPEQAAGGTVTHRSDLFSLGAVVYRALTGTQPFVGDHVVEVLYRVVNAMPPRPSQLTDVPEEVDLVMAIALAKAPTDRFDSAEELRDALSEAAGGRLSEELRERASGVLHQFPWTDPPSPDA